MVEAGIVDLLPRPDVYLGQHVLGSIPGGAVGIRHGPLFSAAASVEVTLHGKGSHGSMPDLAVDPIVLGAAIVTRLQAIVAREVAPDQTAVVTVGSFHAGSRYNIIGDNAKLQLTVRSFTDEQRARLHDGIRRVVMGEAMASGIPADRMPVIDFGAEHTPSLINEPGFTAQVMEPLKERFGADRVATAPPIMPGEDFARYRRTDPAHVQSVLFWVGGERPEKIAEAERTGAALPSLHSPFWAPDAEKVIGTAAEALTASAMRLMPKG